MNYNNLFKENYELVAAIKKEIEEVYFMNDLPWVIGYSGGKDSTCTTQIIIETLIELKTSGKNPVKPVYVVSADTLVENPMIVGTIHNAINSINNLSNKFGIPVEGHIIRPSYNNSFWANLIGRGYPCPNQTFRWCTDRMKINPANEFILSIVDKYGEAIMILGVRDGESASRDRVLGKHTIEGRKLMRHTTMANAYVYAPIRPFTIDDVWAYLLNHNSPWGQDNSELYKLYLESADDDYEMIFDEEQKKKQIGGNSRFGCWVCTVVSKDKSLSSFINKGEEWLIPLRDYRDWLYSIRDNESMRMRRRHNGTIYFSKVLHDEDGSIVIPAKGDRRKIIIKKYDSKYIDNDNIEWYLFEGPSCEDDAKKYIKENSINLSNGENPHILIKGIDDGYRQLGSGPFTIEARKEMLIRLLKLQKHIGEKYELIKKEELLEIRKLWFKYGVWEDNVSKIYFNIFGKELNLTSDDIKLFDADDYIELEKLCTNDNVNFDLVKNVYNLEKKYMGYNNRSELAKNLRKLLSQEFIHVEGGDGSNEN